MDIAAISISQIANFLNGPSVTSMVMLFTSVGVGIVILILIYHWGVYRPGTALSLAPEEHIVQVFHKHWFVFLIEAVVIGALAYAPHYAYLLPKEILDWVLPFNPFLGLLYKVWVAFLATGLLVMATNFFLDIWVLTNKRLVSVDQKSLFHRNTTEMRLEHIEDIHVKISGIIGTLFRIGTLEVDSGGPVKEFSLISISNPEQAKNEISARASQKLDEIKKVKVV